VIGVKEKVSLSIKRALMVLTPVFFILASVSAVFSAFPALAASADAVAVAYTGENYTGAMWEIFGAGDYDLWGGFGLPNDSVCSIRVKPGYGVTIYEHSEFGGDELPLSADTPSLDGKWKRQASSLRVKKTISGKDTGAWRKAIDGDAESFASDGNRDIEAVAAAIKKHTEALSNFMFSSEGDWYGYTAPDVPRSDSERVEMGAELLGIFVELGYDVSEWTENSLAQQMNNIYDWLKTPYAEHGLGSTADSIIDTSDMATPRSVWRVACFALNVSPGMYEEIFIIQNDREGGEEE
jgi:hypothetical protein